MARTLMEYCRLRACCRRRRWPESSLDACRLVRRSDGLSRPSDQAGVGVDRHSGRRLGQLYVAVPELTPPLGIVYGTPTMAVVACGKLNCGGGRVDGDRQRRTKPRLSGWSWSSGCRRRPPGSCRVCVAVIECVPSVSVERPVGGDRYGSARGRRGAGTDQRAVGDTVGPACSERTPLTWNCRVLPVVLFRLVTPSEVLDPVSEAASN